MNSKGLAFYLVLLFVMGCTPQDAGPSEISFPFDEITIEELQQSYSSGDMTVQQVVEAYLDRIERIDQAGPALNAYIQVNPDAISTAEQLDRELQDGSSRGILHGIPVVLKDNINTDDLPTTAGSRFMEGSIPPEDAFIVKKLREQGAVVLGKANLSEWANFHSDFSSSGWSGLGGQTNNPYDITRNPCGSSAGSAVAASANLTVIAIGTETNGSITCPSNANGIVGLKPTVGLWSRSGIIPISYHTDSAGPMMRTVRDAAIVLGALAGTDPDDNITESADENKYDDYTQFLEGSTLEGKRLGYYTNPAGNHFKVDTLMNKAVDYFEEQGATIVEIDEITKENIGGDAFQVLLYEFKDGLNKYFESLGENASVTDIEELAELTKKSPVERERFDRNLIIMASEKGSLQSEEYTSALESMLTNSREKGIDRVMDEHNLDAIISPTGSPAWKTDLILGDNFSISSSSPSAHAGYPIISLPMGNVEGLPVGLSIFGRAWSEPVLLEIAYAYEQGTKHRRVPNFEEK